jgi:uncharacterized protein
MAETSRRGFASMDPSKQKEIASKGGRAAHQKGTAHEFTSGEAREAGRKGGESVSRDREHMSAIGRRGGEHRGMNRQSSTTSGSGFVDQPREEHFGGSHSETPPSEPRGESRHEGSRESGSRDEQHDQDRRGV